MDEPKVTLSLGDVRGCHMITLRGRQISAFRGIPYAKPPVGNLRFKPPEKWTEEWLVRPFDASGEAPQCYQADIFKTWVGQEDCLVVNVYTPEVPQDVSKSNKLPVMVFIHGGGFRFGSGRSSRIGPRKILDHDVILVTLNYRLHAFGFLSNLSKELPGNYGLLDQVEALKWVQENIHAFGGDPNNVTIFGESAGGASISFHLLSKLSTGLFHGAIIMSGHAFGWALQDNPNPIANEFIKGVNCKSENIITTLECLQSLHKEDFNQALTDSINKYTVPFAPVLDGNFITDYPINLYQKGEIVNKVPLMVGTNDKEGLLFYTALSGRLLLKNSDENISKVLAYVLNQGDDSSLGKAVELVKTQYLQSVDTDNLDLFRDKIVDILSDGIIKIPTYYSLNFYLKSGMTPYLYSLDYDTDHSILKQIGFKDLHGATHADELFFLFGDKENFPVDYKRPNDEHEDKFLKLWINFAKYKNPTPAEESDSFVKWEPVSKDNPQVYHLDNPIRLEKLQLGKGLIDFWMNEIPKSLKN